MKKLNNILKIRITEEQYQKLLRYLINENNKSKVVRKMIDDFDNNNYKK